MLELLQNASQGLGNQLAAGDRRVHGGRDRLGLIGDRRSTPSWQVTFLPVRPLEGKRLKTVF